MSVSTGSLRRNINPAALLASALLGLWLPDMMHSKEIEAMLLATIASLS